MTADSGRLPTHASNGESGSEGPDSGFASDASRSQPVSPTITRLDDATPSIRTIGKYSPLIELGRGGTGNVYLALSRGPGGFNKLQVLKVLRHDLSTDPDMLAMFEHEARLSAQINHPNVAQTLEIGHDGGHHYIAMEYLDGQSLEAVFKRAETNGGLPIEMTLRTLSDALVGLHHAHDLVDFQGTALHVVHRDVSPHNIFVTYDGTVKVVDFGIAKAETSQETRTGIIKGKVGYMAPEQLGGSSRAIDRRVDVFAAGAVLWRGLAGKRLWKGLSDVDVFRRLIDGEIPSPTTANPDAPPALVEICMKALAPRPEDRYASAEAMRNAIDAYLREHHPDVTSRSVGAFVSTLYADRRAQVKAAIEQQMRNAEKDDTTSASRIISSPVPALASLVSFPGYPAPTPTGAQPGTASRSAEPPASTSRGRALGAVAAVVLLGVTGAYFSLRAPRAPEVSAPLAVAAVPVPTPGADVAPAPTAPGLTDAHVSVHVTPVTAKVWLDGNPVARPEDLTVTLDATSHEVRVEAPGFASKIVTLVADKPQVDLEVTLEHASAPAAYGHTTHSSPSTHTAHQADPAPSPPVVVAPVTSESPPPQTPRVTNKRALDRDDPWKSGGASAN